MSRFECKRSLKQLYAERKAMELFIKHKEETWDMDNLTVKQVAELRSDKWLLDVIKGDIAMAQDTIHPCDYV